jgi:hypothetical protein
MIEVLNQGAGFLGGGVIAAAGGFFEDGLELGTVGLVDKGLFGPDGKAEEVEAGVAGIGIEDTVGEDSELGFEAGEVADAVDEDDGLVASERAGEGAVEGEAEDIKFAGERGGGFCGLPSVEGGEKDSEVADGGVGVPGAMEFFDERGDRFGVASVDAMGDVGEVEGDAKVRSERAGLGEGFVGASGIAPDQFQDCEADSGGPAGEAEVVGGIEEEGFGEGERGTGLGGVLVLEVISGDSEVEGGEGTGEVGVEGIEFAGAGDVAESFGEGFAFDAGSGGKDEDPLVVGEAGGHGIEDLVAEAGMLESVMEGTESEMCLEVGGVEFGAPGEICDGGGGVAGDWSARVEGVGGFGFGEMLAEPEVSEGGEAGVGAADGFADAEVLVEVAAKFVEGHVLAVEVQEEAKGAEMFVGVFEFRFVDGADADIETIFGKRLGDMEEEIAEGAEGVEVGGGEVGDGFEDGLVGVAEFAVCPELVGAAEWGAQACDAGQATGGFEDGDGDGRGGSGVGGGDVGEGGDEKEIGLGGASGDGGLGQGVEESGGFVFVAAVEAGEGFGEGDPVGKGGSVGDGPEGGDCGLPLGLGQGEEGAMDGGEFGGEPRLGGGGAGNRFEAQNEGVGEPGLLVGGQRGGGFGEGGEEV